MWSRAIESTPAAIRSARHELSDVLRDAGLEQAEELVALLAGELLANVVLHAQTPCTLAVRWDDHVIHVEVSDGSAYIPKPLRYGPELPTGRGLAIVEDLAERWGAFAVDGGKVIWFEVALSADGAA
jgi:anti-sigma regulatory factor (Ser/Thr protein kinase)